MANDPALGEWLTAQCTRRGLSLSEASRKAGVAPNTISEIVNGTNVGMRRIKALAIFFQVSPEYLLRLSGWLPTAETEDSDAILRAKSLELERRWRVLGEKRPDLLEQIVNLAFLQAEFALLAIEAPTEV